MYMRNHTHKETIPTLYNATKIMQMLLQSTSHSKEKIFRNSRLQLKSVEHKIHQSLEHFQPARSEIKRTFKEMLNKTWRPPWRGDEKSHSTKYDFN